jgi:hypothetical protein
VVVLLHCRDNAIGRFMRRGISMLKLACSRSLLKSFQLS